MYAERVGRYAMLLALLGGCSSPLVLPETDGGVDGSALSDLGSELGTTDTQEVSDLDLGASIPDVARDQGSTDSGSDGAADLASEAAGQDVPGADSAMLDTASELRPAFDVSSEPGLDVSSERGLDVSSERGLDAPGSETPAADLPRAADAPSELSPADAPMDLARMEVTVDVPREDLRPEVPLVDVVMDSATPDLGRIDTGGCPGEAPRVTISAPTHNEAIETCSDSGAPVHYAFTASVLAGAPVTLVVARWITPEGTEAPPPASASAPPYVFRRQVGGPPSMGIPALAVFGIRGNWGFEVTAHDACGRRTTTRQTFSLIFTTRRCPNP